MSANSAVRYSMVAGAGEPSQSREFAETQDQSVESQTDIVEEFQEADGTTDSQESSDFGSSEPRSADNLKLKHNKKEKMRRQCLKDSIHALRNQLMIHKTKRATTVSVLKAARIEIHDLKSNEWKQKETIGKLRSHNEDLLQQIKDLRDEWSIPQDSRPNEDLTPPALIKLPLDSMLSPVSTSTVTPYHSPPPTLPFSYLPALPYLPATTGYPPLPLPLLTNTPTHHNHHHLPLYSYGNMWFPQLGYTAVALPHNRLGPTPLYPIYTCVGTGFGHIPNPHKEEERDERTPLPEDDGDDEEVMVDIEGDGTNDDKHRAVRSGLEAAALQSGVVGEAQQPYTSLPSSPPAQTSSHTDMDIVLVANISNQFQLPVKEQLLHRSTAYTLDRFSNKFSSEDNLDQDSCTKHIAVSERPHPIFLGNAQIPATFSYDLL